VPSRRQDGRIYIEKINGAFLFDDKGTPAKPLGSLFLAHLSSQELQLIARSCVNGFSLQTAMSPLRRQLAIAYCDATAQSLLLSLIAKCLAAEIPGRVHAWSRATIERSGVVLSSPRGEGKIHRKACLV
jgi:hypothetical protein